MKTSFHILQLNEVISFKNQNEERWVMYLLCECATLKKNSFQLCRIIVLAAKLFLLLFQLRVQSVINHLKKISSIHNSLVFCFVRCLHNGEWTEMFIQIDSNVYSFVNKGYFLFSCLVAFNMPYAGMSKQNQLHSMKNEHSHIKLYSFIDSNRNKSILKTIGKSV